MQKEQKNSSNIPEGNGTVEKLKHIVQKQSMGAVQPTNDPT